MLGTRRSSRLLQKKKDQTGGSQGVDDGYVAEVIDLASSSSEDEDELVELLSKNMFEALSSDGAADFSSQILSSGSEMATESPGVPQNGQDEEPLEELRWEPETGLPQIGQDGGYSLGAQAGGTGSSGRGVLAGKVDRKAGPEKGRRRETAGRNWFDMPATEITPELKQDLRMLRLRGAMDPKRFYKSFDKTKFPKFFQMGTVIEGPADFYSARMVKKERKGTLTEELLADSDLTRMRTSRYNRLQAERQQWNRKQGRKTNNLRIKKRAKKQKH